MSSASHEVPPQILQLPVMASVLRDLEGLFPVITGVDLFALFEVLPDVLARLAVRLSIFSTLGCIVVFTLFKCYY